MDLLCARGKLKIVKKYTQYVKMIGTKYAKCSVAYYNIQKVKRVSTFFLDIEKAKTYSTRSGARDYRE